MTPFENQPELTNQQIITILLAWWDCIEQLEIADILAIKLNISNQPDSFYDNIMDRGTEMLKGLQNAQPMA